MNLQVCVDESKFSKIYSVCFMALDTAECKYINTISSDVYKVTYEPATKKPISSLHIMEIVSTILIAS